MLEEHRPNSIYTLGIPRDPSAFSGSVRLHFAGADIFTRLQFASHRTSKRVEDVEVDP